LQGFSAFHGGPKGVSVGGHHRDDEIEYLIVPSKIIARNMVGEKSNFPNEPLAKVVFLSS
jgi:hypothetical protein